MAKKEHSPRDTLFFLGGGGNKTNIIELIFALLSFVRRFGFWPSGGIFWHYCNCNFGALVLALRSGPDRRATIGFYVFFDNSFSIKQTLVKCFLLSPQKKFDQEQFFV